MTFDLDSGSARDIYAQLSFLHFFIAGGKVFYKHILFNFEVF